MHVWLLLILLFLTENPLAAQVCKYDSIAATAPAGRFIDNGDGTVTDKITNLQWKRCSEGRTWADGTCSGNASGYTWQQGLQLAEITDYAGHSDWRVPNVKELASILELACYAPAIDLNIFPGVSETEVWWTSTPSAWEFADGANLFISIGAQEGIRSIQSYLWTEGNLLLVRGSSTKLNDTGMNWWSTNGSTLLESEPIDFPGQDASYGRDVNQNDSTDGRLGFSFTKLDDQGFPLPSNAANWSCVRDNVTGLIWEAKTDDGGLRDKDWRYTWYNPDPTHNGGSEGYSDPGTGPEGLGNSNSCSDPARCDTFKFVADANAIGLCGASDWRLPSREELRSLSDYSGVAGIDTEWFHDYPETGYYWASTPIASQIGSVWSINTNTAFNIYERQSKYNTFNIRLVRDDTVRNTPEQPVYSPPPSEFFVPPEKNKNLVLLIHGWNSDPSAWANTMAESIAQKLPNKLGDVPSDPCENPIQTDSAFWQICPFNWSKLAGYNAFSFSKPHFHPWDAYVNALSVGEDLAHQIVEQRCCYNFIHFIAHSAGSQVADTAAIWTRILIATHNAQNLDNPAAQIPIPIIHTTFLDAYDPLGDESNYGKASDWAEQYVDSRQTALMPGKTDYTRITLHGAYNFDVTDLDEAETDILGLHAHAWPYLFYQDTIDGDGDKQDYVYGFKLSKAAGGNPSHDDRPKGGRCIAIDHDSCSDDPQVIADFDKNIVIGDFLNYIEIAKAIYSETGTVSLIASEVLKLITGSPAWAEFPFELSQSANFISFDYAFQRDAEGLLSVFFDGQLVYRVDQRLRQTGTKYASGDVPIGNMPVGAHSLSVRLDAYNDTKSEIDLSNLQLGNKQAVENQPPLADAGTDQALNAGVKVTLDGSGSSDPDQGPSPLIYSWNQTGGPTSALANAATATPSFTPLTAGTYTFELIVNDGLTNSAPDTVTITVNDAPYLKLQTPDGGEVWNESSPQGISWISHNIDSGKRLLIYLSTDGGLNWKKIGGAANDAGSKTWKIPKKRYASKQALLKICLKQTTPLCDQSDTPFTINQAPIAEAGARQNVISGTPVSLNGGASYDPDSGPEAISYSWNQLSGPSIALNDSDTVTPNFTPTEAGTYVFALTVDDGWADSRQDKVKVKVTAAP